MDEILNLNSFNSLPWLEEYFLQLLEQKTMMIPRIFCEKSNCDLFMNRRTHTDFVKRLSNKIADNFKTNHKNIFINRTLLGQIANLHDIGHTPFGHIGEQKINFLIRYKKDSFKEEYPGYFKHNINSARILLSSLNDVDWRIVDGVLKHSAIFSKDFNFLCTKEENLIKLNYIFCDDKKNHSEKDFRTFIQNNFVNVNCYKGDCRKRCSMPCSSELFLNLYKCEKNGFTIFFKDKQLNRKQAFSSYLTYPFSLTYEGAIVAVADEIASFVTDLSDYIYCLKKTQKTDFDFNIVLKQFERCIVLSKPGASLKQLDFIEKLETFIDFLKSDNLQKQLESKNKLFLFGDELTDYVVGEEKASQIFESCFVYISDDGCHPLVYIDPEVDEIRKCIKDIVYGFLHQTSVIKKGNRKGELTINHIVKNLYKNPPYFINLLKDYDLINRVYRSDFLDYFFSSCLSIYRENNYLDENNHLFHVLFNSSLKAGISLGTTFSECSKQFYNIAEEQLADFESIFNNIYYREICFFVSLLTDKEALSVSSKLKRLTKSNK